MNNGNNNMNNPDWAWPALIQSLQRDIAHLRDLMDEARRETAEVREEHRMEINALIEQLRTVKNELDPIIEEREAAKQARRDMVWDWIGKGGWLILAAAFIAFWHYLTSHIHMKVE